MPETYEAESVCAKCQHCQICGIWYASCLLYPVAKYRDPIDGEYRPTYPISMLGETLKLENKLKGKRFNCGYYKGTYFLGCEYINKDGKCELYEKNPPWYQIFVDLFKKE